MKKKKRNKDTEAVKTTPQPGSLAAYAEEYCEWLEIRNFSSQTIHGRRHYLLFFAEWCVERGLLKPAEVTKPVVERYQKWLFHYRKKNGEPLSFLSQHSQLLPVRALFKWLARQNYILYNPASDIDLPRIAKRLPHNALSVAEAESVLNAIDIREPLGIRNRAIIETFYSTGIRRMELVNLQIYDINFEHGTVFIREGKGGKDRMVPIGERAVAWVRKYLYEVRPQLAVMPDNGFLFLSELGEQIKTDRMTELVRGYVTAADIEKKGSCHLFRHTCATLMLEGGADIRYIQQQLGHADLTSTDIYTQVTISKLKEIHTATHPGAKLRPDDRLETSEKLPSDT
jgi:integrase/recombinase XerD